MANTPAPQIDGVGLLERAITYTLGSLHLVNSGALGNSTPCARWDLRALLEHMDDSLGALHEAVDEGRVDVEVPVTGRADVDLVAALRTRACGLIGACAAGEPGVVSIGGCPLPVGIVACAGAVEVAVHGWDVARACGRSRPLPPALAEELLDLVPMFVSAEDRPDRFGPPVVVPLAAGPGEYLLGYLGRTPP